MRLAELLRLKDRHQREFCFGPTHEEVITALAADLLRKPDTTVGAVADLVGYSSPFALSAAFKRIRGMSPTEHRARALAAV